MDSEITSSAAATTYFDSCSAGRTSLLADVITDCCLFQRRAVDSKTDFGCFYSDHWSIFEIAEFVFSVAFTAFWNCWIHQLMIISLNKIQRKVMCVSIDRSISETYFAIVGLLARALRCQLH